LEIFLGAARFIALGRSRLEERGSRLSGQF
jgi:hypothetical protein